MNWKVTPEHLSHLSTISIIHLNMSVGESDPHLNHLLPSRGVSVSLGIDRDRGVDLFGKFLSSYTNNYTVFMLQTSYPCTASTHLSFDGSSFLGINLPWALPPRFKYLIYTVSFLFMAYTCILNYTNQLTSCVATLLSSQEPSTLAK